MTPDLKRFPGGDLIAKGIDDLESGKRTDEAVLVMIAATRLRNLGLIFPSIGEHGMPFGHELSTRLEDRNAAAAHSAYNALIRRLVSFADTYSTSEQGNNAR